MATNPCRAFGHLYEHDAEVEGRRVCRDCGRIDDSAIDDSVVEVVDMRTSTEPSDPVMVPLSEGASMVVKANSGPVVYVEMRSDMTKELFFYCPGQLQGENLAAALQAAGYLVPAGPQEPQHIPNTWTLRAYASEGTEKVWNELHKLARRNQCSFDGWGAYVGPVPAKKEGQ